MALDYKQIAENACAFYNVERIHLDEADKWGVGYPTVPFYVNTAFACELYMKAIICYENPGITKEELKKIGHTLDGLFDRLSENIQKEIKQQLPDKEVQKLSQAKTEGLKLLINNDVPDDVKRIAKYELEHSVVTFNEALRKHARLFEDWRYLYEAPAEKPIFCDEWFLYTFCNTLHNIVVKIMTEK